MPDATKPATDADVAEILATKADNRWTGYCWADRTVQMLVARIGMDAAKKKRAREHILKSGHMLGCKSMLITDYGGILACSCGRDALLKELEET